MFRVVSAPSLPTPRAMRRLTFPLALALAAVLSVTGCDSSGPDDGPGDGAAPPVLAPSAFWFDGSLPGGTANAHGGAGEHFVQAAARVTIVSAAVGVHLLIPHAATAQATQVQPRVEAGTWIWENTIHPNGTAVTFRLEGTPEGQEVEWRMLISSANLGGEAYDAFELYDATTALDGRSGTWRLYYKIDGARTHVLSAGFQAMSSAGGSVTFTVPPSNPNPAARGAEVAYSADGGARLFDYREAQEGRTHLVEWDAITHAGALTAWNYNGGNRACWDADLQNVACVPALF